MIVSCLSTRLVTGILLFGLLSLSACKGHYVSKRISFTSSGDRVSGVFNQPRRKNHGDMPVLVFVHGDGAMTADSFGFYQPIWEHLASNGIASFAWDKKGVGDSEGSWLRQSMTDRAQEVVDAIDALKAAHEDRFSSIGLIGFSQAGWVIPEVPLLSAYPDFMIIISGAINWKNQGDYLTRKRLEGEGLSADAIKIALRRNQAELEFINGSKNYKTWLEHKRQICRVSGASTCETMTKRRFEFVRLNHDVDATRALERVDVPVLALFGEHDLNVNPIESNQIYRKILKPEIDARHRVITYPDASHSLLKSDRFNTQLPGAWWLVKFSWAGKDAFVPNVLHDIVRFVKNSQ